MQYFLTCEGGSWSNQSGVPHCSGELKTYTSQEMALIFNQGLTIEESNQLLVPAIKLFAMVFVILLLKKVLTQR